MGRAARPAGRSWSALGGILALALAGCSSPPEPRYYSLRSPAVAGAGGAAASATASVALLDRFVVDEAYADGRLAYRRASHELGYDPYSRWAGAPGAQVEDAVREALLRARLFRDVRQPEPAGLGRSAYDLVVAGRVTRLEEVDEEEQWRAALGLELYLIDGRTREVLFTSRFDETATAQRRNPREVVASLAGLLDEAVKRFAAGVRPLVAGRGR